MLSVFILAGFARPHLQEAEQRTDPSKSCFRGPHTLVCAQCVCVCVCSVCVCLCVLGVGVFVCVSERERGVRGRERERKRRGKDKGCVCLGRHRGVFGSCTDLENLRGELKSTQNTLFNIKATCLLRQARPLLLQPLQLFPPDLAT